MTRISIRPFVCEVSHREKNKIGRILNLLNDAFLLKPMRFPIGRLPRPPRILPRTIFKNTNSQKGQTNHLKNQ